MKKFFLTALIAVLVILAGFGVWYSLGDDRGSGESDTDSAPRTFLSFFGISGDREPSDERDADTGALPEGTAGTQENGRGGFVSPLRQVWSEPTHAARFVTKDTGEEAVRFIERATGNIFEALATSSEIIRLTNTTIPEIQEVFWIRDDRIVIRYLRDVDGAIETFVGEILPPDVSSTSTDEVVGSLGGFFLPTNITALAVNETSGDIFYLTETEEESLGFVTPGSAHTPQRVFSSPAREWLPEWRSGESLLLTTKPSRGIPGYAYTLSTKTGSFTKVLSDASGLTTKPIYGSNQILYSITLPTLRTYTYETAAHVSVPFVVQTLPEKCVAGAGRIYCAAPASLPPELPDSWYQGRVSFTDRLWSLHPDSGAGELVLDPYTFTNEPLDIVSLAVNDAGNLFAFINKRNGSLWIYHEETATLPE